MSTPVKPPKQFSSLDPELKHGHRLKFERRITLLALLAGFPAVALCALLLWYDGYSAQVQWTIDLLLVLLWLGISVNLRTRIVQPLQTLSNILAAIREGDYSIRGRRALSGDALGEVVGLDSEVTYLELPAGRARTVRVVHPAAADASAARVSVFAPVARALLGRRPGARVPVALPDGAIDELHVISVVPARRPS